MDNHFSTFQQKINANIAYLQISHHCNLTAKSPVAGTGEVKCKDCLHFWADFPQNLARNWFCGNSGQRQSCTSPPSPPPSHALSFDRRSRLLSAPNDLPSQCFSSFSDDPFSPPSHSRVLSLSPLSPFSPSPSFSSSSSPPPLPPPSSPPPR